MSSIDYAKIRKQIIDEASEIRGVIIQHFSHFEVEIMDVLILGWAFDNNDELESFIRNNLEWKVPMWKKKQLLKKGIERYQQKSGEELTDLYANIDSILESRNILAHWMADILDDGIDHYLKHKSIRFLATNPKAIFNKNENAFKEAFFDKDKVQELYNKINEVGYLLKKIIP